jgi:hypothetical protein
MTAVQFQRSPHLAMAWRGARLELHHFPSQKKIRVTRYLLDVLEHFSTWQDLRSYLQTVPEEARGSATELVHELHRGGFLRRRGARLPAFERGLDAWKSWNPAAGSFHAATRRAETRRR